MCKMLQQGELKFLVSIILLNPESETLGTDVRISSFSFLLVCLSPSFCLSLPFIKGDFCLELSFTLIYIDLYIDH